LAEKPNIPIPNRCCDVLLGFKNSAQLTALQSAYQVAGRVSEANAPDE
jgi:hypothetical protein